MEVKPKPKKRRGFQSIIKGIDNYGYPITLTYKNKTEYKSLLGGLITILFRLIVFIYIVYALKELITRRP